MQLHLIESGKARERRAEPWKMSKLADHQEDKEERAFWEENLAEAKAWQCFGTFEELQGVWLWRSERGGREKRPWGPHHGVRHLIVSNGNCAGL